MDKGIARPGVRITDQFRKRHAMVYDLSCEDVRLTIEVSPRQNDDGLGGWVVEAHARQAVDRRALVELGETRSDALHALARAWMAWMAKQGVLGFAFRSSTGTRFRWRCSTCARSGETPVAPKRRGRLVRNRTEARHDQTLTYSRTVVA